MHDRISHCECSHRPAHKTIGPRGDLASGSSESSPRSLASPECLRGRRSWRHRSRGLQAEEDRRRQVRETLEKTLGEVRRESETPLSLRLRDLITDDVFVARKADLDIRMREFEARLSAPPGSQDEVVRLTADVFRFASRAAQVFQTGSGVQKRMILEAVGSNYTLKGREVAFSLRIPFSRIAQAGASADWWTCGDDVRTWIEDSDTWFCLPATDHITRVNSRITP